MRGVGMVDIGPLFIGLFDGPEIVVAWRQVVVWQWRRRFRTSGDT